MAKKKQNYAVPRREDQLGCMSGLIGILDLHHAHPTPKMISDHWQGKHKQPNGAVNISGGLNMRKGSEQNQKKIYTTSTSSGGGDRNIAGMEAGKTSINNFQYGGKAEAQKSKKLFKYAMKLANHDSKFQSACKKNRKRANKIINYQVQSNSANLYPFMDEACSQSNRYQELQLEQQGLNTKLLQKHVIHDQRLTDAVENFLNQKFVEAKQVNTGGAIHQSRVIKDALEVLNLNKKLFTKMLEDPNSFLAKHIQDLRKAQMGKVYTTESHKHLGESKLSEGETCTSSKYVEPANPKTISENFRYFRRKYTKKGMGSFKGGEIYNSSNKTVFSKPNSITSGTRFSLADLKMKLKGAIRERKRNQPDVAYNSHNLADNGKDSCQNGTAPKVCMQLSTGYKEGSSEDYEPKQRDEFDSNNLSLLGQENENNKIPDSRKNETDSEIEGNTAEATPSVGNCILENIRGKVKNKGTLNTLCSDQQQGPSELTLVRGREQIFKTSRENLSKETPSLSSALASSSPECILDTNAEVTEALIEKPEWPNADIIPAEHAISPTCVSSTQTPKFCPQERESYASSEIAFCQNPSEEVLYECITSVPVATCFSCEALERRSHSPSLKIDPSLLAQLESTVSKLLLYTNENLQDIHKQLLDCLSKCLFINLHMQANLVDQEILDIIDWYLNPPDPHTLEKIFCKDLAKDRSWMDLRFDTEEISWKLGDAILEELVKEIILDL